MTEHRIKVLEDGTRVYSNHTRYKPMPDDLRKNRRRRPDDPRAVRFKGDWFLPLDLLDDAERELPETRPDTDAYDHMTKPRKCRCFVCLRPEAQVWKDKWIRDQARS